MALRHGADDYMVKPLRFRESIARLERIVVRARKRSDEQAHLRIGVYEIDFQQRIVFQAGQPVDLTRKEFDLAVLFLSNLGRRFSGPVICEYVWGYGSAVSGRTIQTYISRLRAKLGLRPANGWRFVATYRHGYRLERVEEHS